MINAILLALAPIFFVLLLGFAAGRMRLVDNIHVDGLNAVVMSVALPASLFAATASAPRSELIAQAPLFLIFGAAMLVVFFGWYFFQVHVAQADKADASLQALTIAFPNLAGVGLPIMAQVLGPAGTVPVAVALACGSIIISPISLIIVELSRKDGDVAQSAAVRIVRALERAVTKPVVLAPALGILFSLVGLKTIPVVDACLLLIGHAAPGVALFLTGLILSSQPFESDWKVIGATGMADIIRPLLAVAAVLALPVSAETFKVVILLSTVPSGFFGILFAVNYRLDSAAVGSMVTASTVFSIVTMAIAIAVLFPR
jgi:malonate transporter